MNNTSGGGNTAVGTPALDNNATGNNNVAIGNSALFTNVIGNDNTAIGINTLSLSTGDFNVAPGANAGSNQDTGTNNIYVGDTGFAGESNVIAIGNLSSSGSAYTDTFIGGVFGASVNAVTAVAVFVDDSGKLGTMLVGDDGNGRRRVAKPAADRDQSMLDELRKTKERIAELETAVAHLASTVKEQAAQIQKVSAQLELSKPAPQTVENND